MNSYTIAGLPSKSERELLERCQKIIRDMEAQLISGYSDIIPAGMVIIKSRRNKLFIGVKVAEDTYLPFSEMTWLKRLSYCQAILECAA